MTAVPSPFEIPMVQLVPRDWMPNPHLTGGNLPGQTLYMPHSHWVALGSPSTIEDYYDRLSRLDAAPRVNTIDFRGFSTPQEM